MSLSPNNLELIDAVVALLHRSRSLLLITGAGLSADSGLPTYRGSGGLYATDPEADGPPIEELLSAEGMRRDPQAVWRHLGRVEQACRDATPNRGHAVIAAMEQEFERVWVLTQNVDGFHQRAGSRHVIAIHGNLHTLRCCSCSYRTSVESFAGLDPLPPTCPACGGMLRPDVVLFGEHLDQDNLDLYYREVNRAFDLVISIGTSSLFDYIMEPVIDAALFERASVEINPEPTQISELVTLRLPLGAEAALVAIWERYGGSLP
jgi:NAD-dependent deacetylase